MTREKKTRKPPAQGPKRKALEKKSANDKLSKKKGKGQATGGRHNVAKLETSDSKLTQADLDRRHGSKKPIQLVIDKPVVVAKPSKAKVEPKPTQAPIAAVRMATVDPEQALESLESDPRLEALLERLENGKTLSAADQTWLDNTLSKIEVLMAELGYEIEDDSEEGLLDRFESGENSLNSYKKD